MTTADEIAMAVAAGADAIGVILAESPRRVPLERLPELGHAVPPYVAKFAVVADPTDDEAAAALRSGCVLQFSGGENPARCMRLADGHPYVKVFHVKSAEPFERDEVALLESYRGALWAFDTAGEDYRGGTGVPFAWRVVEPLSRLRPVVVAGGLRPDNVAECVRLVRPFAVDVRSGIESDGRKDEQKMRDFVRAVREADA